MKPLLKVMLILGSVFAMTFIAGRLFGILTVENVREWLELASNVDPYWLAGVIIFLLFLDLFVAVPTLTITILAGYFLGFPFGAAAAFIGMLAAAAAGYMISRIWGEKPIALLVKDIQQRKHMFETFQKSGPAMIVLSRAAPIVTEVTACMAGATKMGFHRYLIFFVIGTLPYVLIASFAGSISSVESPQPAIFAVLFLYLILWTGWYLYRRISTR